jgi:carboxyl-terminal processing protease
MRIMKVTILFLALVIMISMSLEAQSQTKVVNKKTVQPVAVTFNPKVVIDSVVLMAKAIALNSSFVLWDSVQKQMYGRAFDAKSVYDLKKSFEFLLVSLKDDHGVFFDPSTNTSVAEYPNKKTSNRLTEKPEFFYGILEHNVRYIRIVSASGGDDAQSQAEKIRQGVDSLMTGEATHWIVDLRYATGGDMNPMFAGLAPILDEGLVASTVDNRGKIVDMYTVHNGNFYINQVRFGKFTPHATDMRNAKVAVLTSQYTSGAAEILAIGLKGKRHSKLFGETTAGDIFGMSSITFRKNLVLKLSQTMYVNKKGIEYHHPVDPDAKVDFAPPGDLNHDEAIKQASHWLRSNDGEPAVKVANN